MEVSTPRAAEPENAGEWQVVPVRNPRKKNVKSTSTPREKETVNSDVDKTVHTPTRRNRRNPNAAQVVTLSEFTTENKKSRGKSNAKHVAKATEAPPKESLVIRVSRDDARVQLRRGPKYLRSNIEELDKKEKALAQLQEETEALRKIVDEDISTYCTGTRLGLTESFLATLPRELRLMVYDTFLIPFREDLKKVCENWDGYYYYRDAELRDMLHLHGLEKHPSTLIFRETKVGRFMAQEAAAYAYSKIPLCLGLVTQIKHFLVMPHDVFRLGLNPMQYVRNLRIWIGYRKKSPDGWRTTNQYCVKKPAVVRELRDEQIRCLRALLTVPSPEGFKLKLDFSVDKEYPRAAIQKTEILKDIGEVLCEMVGVGFVIEFTKFWVTDRYETCEGWLGKGIEHWQQKVEDLRKEVDPKVPDV